MHIHDRNVRVMTSAATLWGRVDLTRLFRVSTDLTCSVARTERSVAQGYLRDTMADAREMVGQLCSRSGTKTAGHIRASCIAEGTCAWNRPAPIMAEPRAWRRSSKTDRTDNATRTRRFPGEGGPIAPASGTEAGICRASRQIVRPRRRRRRPSLKTRHLR